MHIYIDESGSFLIPFDKKPLVSCIAALVIPSIKKKAIFKEFLKLRRSWNQDMEEIKGSTLDETQVAAAISLLRKYDVLVETYAIDMGSHTEQQIVDFKRMQADKITEHITPEYHPDMVSDLNRLRATLLSMSNQLFVQSFMMIMLIDRLIEIAPLYYCQRIPQELGRFYWAVDAKDRSITKSEEWWSTVMMPIMQTRSLQRPTIGMVECDYSYFQRFRVLFNKAPDYFKEVVEDPESPFSAINLKLLMQEHFAFRDSKHNIGLQLADIIVSTVSRAYNMKLKKEGWQDLGSLIVKKKKQTVGMIRLNIDPQLSGKTVVERNYHGYVREEIVKKAKPMLLSG